jgi:hypothetical protein
VEEAVNDEDVDRFFTLFAKRHTTVDGVDGPRLANGDRPRGLAADGLVRTTGWLQFGSRPVSSALIAALVGLAVTALIIAAFITSAPPVGGLIALLPALFYCGWRLLTVRLLPASTARAIGTAPASEVTDGSWVRLHGSIGPVAQVASTRPDNDLVEVTFVGGHQRSWPQQHRLHLAELLD